MWLFSDYPAGDPKKYEGLEMSIATRQLLENDPKAFAAACNGVGSRIGFWNKLAYHFIPNFIGLINITPASDLHDVEFTVPITFATMSDAVQAWEDANMRFLSNCRRLIERGTRLSWIRKSRYWVACRYYKVLGSSSSWQSFLAGRNIIDASK